MSASLKDKSSVIEQVAGQYLQRTGLSFDFGAGMSPYHYQVAIGAAFPDVLVGSDARDYFWGMEGDDVLHGGAEGDNLFGDSGNDMLMGEAGGDRLVGGMGDDHLHGGDDADALWGGEGDDYLDEGAGHGDLVGGAGNDTLVGGMGADAFAVGPDSGDDVIKDFTAGPGMFDHLALHDLAWEDLAFADTEAGVVISWAGGSVLLEGVFMADLAQDDFMFADAPELPPGAREPAGPAPERATPDMHEHPMPDMHHHMAQALPGAAFGHFADAMLKTSGSFQLAFAGDEAYTIAVGSMMDDDLQGSEAWDQLFGLDGNDVLEGADGADILQGDAGNDQLMGGAGMDKLDGGMGDDHLTGGDEADELMGMEGDDVLDGGAGHDMLEGGMGNDTLTGGTGADAFIVHPDSGHDIVLDFEATDAAQGAFDHIAFVHIMPEQVSVADTAEGALVSWDTNADGTAEGSVLLQGVYTADLRQSDFMFNEEPAFVAGISTVGSWYIFPDTPA
jgi:serralysin